MAWQKHQQAKPFLIQKHGAPTRMYYTTNRSPTRLLHLYEPFVLSKLPSLWANLPTGLSFRRLWRNKKTAHLRPLWIWNRPKNFVGRYHSFSFTRFLLLGLIISFLVFVSFGILGPAVWNWKRITFVVLSLCALYITSVVPEHYLDDHIWEHIIKHHLFRVFLWSFGALLFVHWGHKVF